MKKKHNYVLTSEEVEQRNKPPPSAPKTNSIESSELKEAAVIPTPLESSIRVLIPLGTS